MFFLCFFCCCNSIRIRIRFPFISIIFNNKCSFCFLLFLFRFRIVYWKRKKERKKESCLCFYFFLASLLYLSISIPPHSCPYIHPSRFRTFVRSFVFVLNCQSQTLIFLIHKCNRNRNRNRNSRRSSTPFLSLQSTRVGSIWGLIYINETSKWRFLFYLLNIILD